MLFLCRWPLRIKHKHSVIMHSFSNNIPLVLLTEASLLPQVCVWRWKNLRWMQLLLWGEVPWLFSSLPLRQWVMEVWGWVYQELCQRIWPLRLFSEQHGWYRKQENIQLRYIIAHMCYWLSLKSTWLGIDQVLFVNFVDHEDVKFKNALKEVIQHTTLLVKKGGP